VSRSSGLHTIFIQTQRNINHLLQIVVYTLVNMPTYMLMFFFQQYNNLYCPAHGHQKVNAPFLATFQQEFVHVQNTAQ
jgi:hypothetical protein